MSVTTSESPPRRRSLRETVVGLRHRGPGLETKLSIGLGVASAVLTAMVVALPDLVPTNTLMVPLLVGSLFLGPRTLPWFVIYLMLLLTGSVLAYDKIELTDRVIVSITVQFLMGLIVLFTSFRRARLGVGGLRGESMLVDLRDRILTQGGIPALPDGWSVDSAIHSAGGTPFAGDFVVAIRALDPDRLEVVVVDDLETVGVERRIATAMGQGVPPAEWIAESTDQPSGSAGMPPWVRIRSRRSTQASTRRAGPRRRAGPAGKVVNSTSAAQELHRDRDDHPVVSSILS